MHLVMRRYSLGGAAFLTALGVAAPAGAEQFVVAEATYTHSAETTKDSHYFVPPTPETPANWQSPVDYAHGSVHVRLEVKTKPSAEPTRYQICFEMKQNYCCTNQAPPYTAPGIYEWDTDVEDLWRPGPVDFAQGIVRNALILKDTENVKPAPENVGEETSKLYMPSDLSVTVTVVSAGSEFMPPEEPTPMGGSGGGGAGGMSGGGAGFAGEPALGGAASGSGGAPVVTPEPTAGTAPSGPMMPSGGAAGATGMLPAAASPADSGGCSFSARGGSMPLGLLALFGAFALSTRQARRRRPSSPCAARPAPRSRS